MSGLEIIPVATASSSIDGSLSAYNDVESNEVKVEMGYVGDNRYTNHNQEVDNDNMKLVHRWKRIFIGMLFTLILTAVVTIIEILRNDSPATNIALVAVLTTEIFCLILAFLKYDKHMQCTNNKIVHQAAKSMEFVSSMFPANMHQRLFDSSLGHLHSDEPIDNPGNEDDARTVEEGLLDRTPRMESDLKRQHSYNRQEIISRKSKPIAELYPETTIMLADLVGFTAWSSAREPAQVFILLESIFRVFDELAIRRKIFKVETVGDCYVAVAGLPEARSDHAVAMARFAQDCLSRFTHLVQKLELSLGPGTADLGMRIGLHSGPITGGILRGERSRFQLFGDTINTAARMESNSMRGRIQVSEQTADLLFESNKENWLIKREDKINAKGKGKLQTYWLDIKGAKTASTSDLSSGNGIAEESTLNAHQVGSNYDTTTTNGVSVQHAKLIEFNTDCLVRLLKQISARRSVSKAFTVNTDITTETTAHNVQNTGTIRDEVKECIQLPAFNAGIERSQPTDTDSMELDPNAIEELRDYLSEICKMYNRSNYFHNFEHATHVAMSVLKLISRIVSPLELLSKQYGSVRRLNASKLYDHTYGLTSDPLTLFACAFSALIHDVDHPGVTNIQLLKENGDLAKKYNNKSIAEQHAFDISWDLLMSDKYSNLRSAIFMNQTEQKHFRQIVINCVMATDIMDPELKEVRNRQWRQTFTSTVLPQRYAGREMGNRKATIVIEHLMQTSDIAHTMQHWHIYCKWNERLYREQLVAFLTGRTDLDPTTDWYENELHFFDFCVIPLAQKLKECGVFGVSSHEYLNYALNNRKEWESTGREIVAEMSEMCKTEIMADIMRHMAGEGETAAPPTGVICYTISDQLGPESLLLTNSWSKDNSSPSTQLLGNMDRPPSPDDDLF